MSVIRQVETNITAELDNLKNSRHQESNAVKHAEKQLKEQVAKLKSDGEQGRRRLLEKGV